MRWELSSRAQRVADVDRSLGQQRAPSYPLPVPAPGAGKPLRNDGDHAARFHAVNPLVAAATRAMGAQGVRPLSLELREEASFGKSALLLLR